MVTVKLLSITVDFSHYSGVTVLQEIIFIYIKLYLSSVFRFTFIGNEMGSYVDTLNKKN